MKTKFFTFIILAAFSFVNAQELEVLKVPTGSEPTIDGIMDENDPWSEDSWIPMEQNVSTGTTTDMTTQFQMLHNNEMIYIIQQIVDATPHNEVEDNTYQNDCAEVLFHLSDVNDEAAYSASTCQIRFQRDGDGETGMDDGSDKSGAIIAELNLDDRFEWMAVSDEEGWILEIAFPIDILDGASTFNGTDFFFDIKATDNTDGTAANDNAGRTQQTYWATAEDGKWNDASQIMGVITLSDTEIPTSISKTDIKTGSVNVVNNMLNFVNIEGPVSIYSITGALVKKDVAESNSTMDISSLNNSIYFVKTETLTIKFVK